MDGILDGQLAGHDCSGSRKRKHGDDARHALDSPVAHLLGDQQRFYGILSDRAGECFLSLGICVADSQCRGGHEADSFRLAPENWTEFRRFAGLGMASKGSRVESMNY